jgi:hypothetical protein
MTYIRLENASTLYCEVQPNVGNEPSPEAITAQPRFRLAGTLTYKEGEISLRLVQFDRFFRVPDSMPLLARTEAWNAALYGTLTPGTGQRGLGGQVAYCQDIFAHIAVIGRDCWTADHRVWRTRFRVPGADRLLHLAPTFRGVAQARAGDQPGYEVLEVAVEGATIRVGYGATYSMDADYPRDIWPTIEMEFSSGLSLEETGRLTMIMCASYPLLDQHVSKRKSNKFQS